MRTITVDISPEDFDSSELAEELESRGWYVSERHNVSYLEPYKNISRLAKLGLNNLAREDFEELLRSGELKTI